MKKIRVEKFVSGKCKPGEHLKQCLKSSYKERLAWLEEANALRSAVVIHKVRKPKRRTRPNRLKRITAGAQPSSTC
jgi:hypothetical protein